MRSLSVRIKHAQYVKEWRRKNPSSYKAIYQRYFQKHHEKIKTLQLKYRQHLRKEVFKHYGDKCTCCGETMPEFLAIDHINGGGNKHRKTIGINSGFQFARWLRKEGYPNGFQILCHNCNMAKAHWGKCPHQKV